MLHQPMRPPRTSLISTPGRLQPADQTYDGAILTSPEQSELSGGCARKLAGFIVDGRLVARHGYEIYDGNGKIGHVTSGSMSPCLNKNIGLGYVETKYSTAGTKIKIKVRNDFIEAEVVKIPFVGKD